MKSLPSSSAFERLPFLYSAEAMSVALTCVRISVSGAAVAALACDRSASPDDRSVESSKPVSLALLRAWATMGKAFRCVVDMVALYAATMTLPLSRRARRAGVNGEPLLQVVMRA